MSTLAAYGLSLVTFALGLLVGALCQMARYPDIDDLQEDEHERHNV